MLLTSQPDIILLRSFDFKQKDSRCARKIRVAVFNPNSGCSKISVKCNQDGLLRKFMNLRFWLPRKEGIALLGNDGQLMEINGVLSKMCGYSCKEEMLAVGAINHIVKEDRLTILKEVTEQLEKGFDPLVLCKLLKKNRSEMRAKLVISRARNSWGKPIGFVVGIKERKGRI